MIRSFLFLFFMIPFFLLAEWDQLFLNDEDPSVFQHVNVISGHLNLSIQDTTLQGAYPFSLTRTYSSSGALECTKDNTDLKLKILRRGWLLQGGWNFLPHANLLVILERPTNNSTFQKAHFRLSEPGGSLLSYSYSHKEKIKSHTYHYYYKPEKKSGAHAGILSARQDPQNNLLRVFVDEHHPKEFEVDVFLANGGIRHYRKLFKTDRSLGTYYYRLEWEELPSKRCIVYSYDKEDRLFLIDIKNPSRTKTYSWILFNFIHSKTPFQFEVTTSDSNCILYKGIETHLREYFGEVTSNCKKKENFRYSRGGSRMGFRVNEILLEDNSEVKAHYYDSSKPLLERDAKFYRKHFEVDKVKSLESPVGQNGEMKTIAEFHYEDQRTNVRDVDGALIRYHYQEDRISKVEHFHREGPRHTVLEFIWKEGRLRAKALCNGEGKPLFSKTFHYDSKGNVEEETLWGQLSGLENKESFSLNSDGSLSGAESYRKHYTYDSNSNLLIHEREEDGLSYQYTYKQDTDLLTQKLTKKGDQILKREFFLYDDNHFLIAEMIDDGTGHDLSDLRGVSQRQIKRYEIDENTGLISSLSELYLDLPSGREALIQKHVYGYNSHRLRDKEEIYDAEGNYRYTLYTKYDDRGHVISQSAPLGGENTYKYNHKDHLVEKTEIGLPKKIYTHDLIGRALSCEEIDDEGKSKTSYSAYDLKGRLTSQTDFLGHETRQEYDTFGRCIKTEFPKVKDEFGQAYNPCLFFTYDACGNLTSHTNPRGETTETEYNVFQKPIRIVRADKTILLHIYHKNGTLAKTIESDQTEIHYTYDPFLRITSKKIYDSSGNLLSQETWDYDSFCLRSHTNENGLVTSFSYDGSGKKIFEVSGDREYSFSYDALGFLETTTFGDTSNIELHDIEGNVTEKWESRGSLIENHTKLHCNSKGLLEKTDRITSQGEVHDLFSYDQEGRLCLHTDPLGAKTQFIYYPVRNDLEQLVFCKITINALGYKTLDTDDASNRLVSREKQDETGKTLSFEEFFYDKAGNKTKRVSTVYLKDSPLKKITYLSEHDSMGRLVKEIEADKKVTSYSYDERGRVKTKTLPSGTILTYSYDGMGRVLSLDSSDRTVHYRYDYETGSSPTRVKDLISNQVITRSYNLFGEICEEISSKRSLSWDYDEMGRCTRFTLPDFSSITREYFDGHLYSVTRRDSNNFPSYAHTYLKTDPNNHIEEERLIYDLGTIHTSHDLLERPFLQTSKWNTHKVRYDLLGRVSHIDSSLFREKKITYDPLNQLTQEGENAYLFDSIGNSSIYETNDCNEVLSTPNSNLIYDLEGNLKDRILADQTILYSYDALGRLTSITYPHKKILYSYDPFSRLFSKETYLVQNGTFQKTDELFFLYDQDKEIGALNEQGEILQLKILGLGIAGEIGAAVAIELNQIAYAPLHDFSGNCVALLSSSGELFEKYQIDAFGKEVSTPSSPQNPWRFSSKRQEEGLVFFGFRFYDLALERWLTPDPAGFADGPNLYAYVLNSPLNRLDLFGLNGFDLQQRSTPRVEVSILHVRAAINSKGALLRASAITEGIPIDWHVSCGHWHQIQFSTAEIKTGKINLLDHFAELMPKEGNSVGLLTLQNGIRTNLSEFKQMGQSVVNKIPEGTLFLGMYNPTSGLGIDIVRTVLERFGIETRIVRHTSQMMGAIADTIHKINPELVWLDTRHSEGGVIGRRAIEKLSSEQKQILKEQFYCLAAGPAKLMPAEYGLEVYNLYSTKDGITGRWAKEQQDGFTYNVKFLEAISPRKDRTLWFADHGFLKPTYQKGVADKFQDVRIERGFYNGNMR